MRAFNISPARRNDKRAALAALMAWAVLVLLVAAAVAALAVRDAAANGLAAITAPARFAPRAEPGAQQNLLWVIGDQTLMLYDGRMRTLIKRVDLPDWSYVDEPQSCAPAIAIDDDGHALVSSNVQPDLWRVDSRSQAVERLAIELDADTNQEVGFTGLVFIDAKTLLAVSAIQGSLWRIDLETRKAHKIALARPLRGLCALGLMPSVAPVAGVPPQDRVLCASARNTTVQIRLYGVHHASLLEQPCLHAVQPAPEKSR